MDITAIAVQFMLALAIFLCSLRLLSMGLQGSFMPVLRPLLGRMTTTPLRGFFVGAGVTLFVQSSSAVAAAMVAFVNAGVLSLPQAFGLVLGANLGTTITAQIISLPLGHLGWPVAGIGWGLWIIRRRQTAVALIGLGTTLWGLELLKLSMRPVLAFSLTRTIIGTISEHWVLGLAGGCLITAIVQSSSAVSGVLIALAAEGAMRLSGGAIILLGSNVGTVATSLLAAMGFSPRAKALAYADLLFNLFGVLLILPILPLFVALIRQTSCDVSRQIANAHTIFNLITAIIGLWFIRPLVELSARMAGIDDETANKNS